MKILIAAGGTGGHIFPAIALGEALHNYYPEVEFDYLCGERELEQKLYRDNRIEPIVFPARQIGAGILGKLQGARAAIGNTARAFELIRGQNYDVVIGMGGYVAGPAVLAGALARKYTAVHEANSIPGKTNKLLAPFVKLFASHFNSCRTYVRTKNFKVTGMPIRQGITRGSRSEAVREFQLAPDKRTLVILGGSQGAKFLYQNLMKSLPALDITEHADVQILWSTGSANFEEMRMQRSSLVLDNLTVRLVPFIKRIDLAMAVTDAAVARAGASSIAELLSNGIYSLYIPFPAAIYDHQTQNAREVAAAGAGEMLAEKDLTPEKAAEAIARLLARTRRGVRLEVPANLDSENSAQKLAELLVSGGKANVLPQQ
jgi:UDP-N-acetylglucosamine--N-acetylmuramyl-(pentapeptide) pyrophosphoryl-undecaprenol N-acetylglucosamine transferase